MLIHQGRCEQRRRGSNGWRSNSKPLSFSVSREDGLNSCPIHFPFGVSYSIGPGLIDWACNSIILSFWRTDTTVYAVALLFSCMKPKLGWYGGWFLTHDCLLADSDCSICYLPSSYLLIPLLWNNFLIWEVDFSEISNVWQLILIIFAYWKRGGWTPCFYAKQLLFGVSKK